jgi:hypothetical protein
VSTRCVDKKDMAFGGIFSIPAKMVIFDLTYFEDCLANFCQFMFFHLDGMEEPIEMVT